MNRWPTERLGDIAEIERDAIEPRDIKDGTPYVGLENIQSGGVLVNVRAVDAGELASNKFQFSRRHVLFGKLRPYLAKIARPDFEGICSTDILPVLPGPKLDRNYLSHFLLTPRMVSIASSLATGANLPRLSPTALAELPVPLPPVSEQRRIAAILDKADALRAKRRAALAQFASLSQAIFLDMFGDPVPNERGWKRVPFASLLGVSPSNRCDGHIRSCCAPTISVAALGDGRAGGLPIERGGRIGSPFTGRGDRA